MFDQIIKYAEGNPGALNFLMQVMQHPNPMVKTALFSRLDAYETLRGTNLYVLYADLAGKNMDSVVKLLKSVPQVVLEDACSRQDYSGRELVAPYLNLEN